MPASWKKPATSTVPSSFEGRRPRSEYRLTQVGRKALHRYLEHIEAVIKATRKREYCWPPGSFKTFITSNNSGKTKYLSMHNLHVGIIMDGNGRWLSGAVCRVPLVTLRERRRSTKLSRPQPALECA